MSMDLRSLDSILRNLAASFIHSVDYKPDLRPMLSLLQLSLVLIVLGKVGARLEVELYTAYGLRILRQYFIFSLFPEE